jgi:hypothetical protein
MKDNGVLTFVELDAKTLQRLPGNLQDPSRCSPRAALRYMSHEPHILDSTIAIKISQEDRFELRLALR